MCCVSGLEACACLAVPAVLGCVCGLRPSVFLRTDSTSQPAAAGSHHGAGNTHTLTCTHMLTQTSFHNFHGNQLGARSWSCQGWRREGRGALSSVLDFWFGWLMVIRSRVRATLVAVNYGNEGTEHRWVSYVM